MQTHLQDFIQQSSTANLKRMLSGAAALIAVLFAVSFVVSAESASTPEKSSEKKVSNAIKLDETPAAENDWGYRPADKSVSTLSPPSFVWRPTQKVVRWELEIKNAEDKIVYRADDIVIPSHTPDIVLPAGLYSWKYRGFSDENVPTQWSVKRSFTIGENAIPYPLPSRKELLSRIPKDHPRVFLRPEMIPKLKQLAEISCKSEFDELVKYCDSLVASPPELKALSIGIPTYGDSAIGQIL